MNYYGKYRGVVTNISDPQNMGRLKANVPAITGEFETSWCIPCLAIPNVVILPKVGDTVWIEFERGKVEYPIWVGSWNPQSKPVTQGVYKLSADGVSLGCGNKLLSNAWVLQKIEELKSYCNSTFKLK